MKIKKIQVDKYKCPVCGTLYGKEEDAQLCMENNEMIEKFKNIPSYMWVHLKCIYDNSKDRSVFISKCKMTYRYSPSDVKCLNKSLEFDDAEYYQYFSTDNWDIIEYFTIEEYYEKTGKFPMIDERYPEYINNRIRTTVEKEQNKILDRFNSMSKDELIKELQIYYDVFKIK